MRRRVAGSLRGAIALLAISASVFGGAPAAYATYSGVGYDVSWPQCSGPSSPTTVPLPSSAPFAIVGVTGGLPFATQSCLTAEWRWAEAKTHHVPSAYMNTANPGPGISKHWPIGQNSPNHCTAAQSNAWTCSFDYGWNAANDAFNKAVAAKMAVGNLTHSVAVTKVAATTWWLDVEEGPGWETLEHFGNTSRSQFNDTMSIYGSVRALQAHGVKVVGLNSTKTLWTDITGGASVNGTRFDADPLWLAGFRNQVTASAGCHNRALAFTKGKITLTQFHLGGFDADFGCP